MKAGDSVRNSATRRGFLKAFSVSAIAVGAGVLPPGESVVAQSKPDTETLSKPFVGRWRYRSFRNVPDVVTKLDDILFWEAILNVTSRSSSGISGDIGDGQDKLTIKGFVTFGFPNFIRFEGTGLDGTGTAGWKYNYAGFLVPEWPDGIDQRDAIVGSVIRTVPHTNGKAKAGYVASFVAVKLDQATAA